MLKPWTMISVTMIALLLLAGCTPAAPTPTSVLPAATVDPTPLPPPTAAPTPVPTATPEPAAGTIVLIFGQAFIPSLYSTVRLALERANYRVVVASESLEPLKPKSGGEPVQPDLLLADLRVADYDAVVFTCDNDLAFGGARPQTDRIAQEAVAQGKILAAICNAPMELGWAGVLRGLKATGEPSQTCRRLEQEFGATCTEAAVERDGRIITGRDRYASSAFAQAILDALQEPRPAPVPSSDTWVRSYQGQITGTVVAGTPTLDGGFLFVGSTHYTHYNRDDEDIYLLKTDAAGEPLWEKTLGGDRFDRGVDIMPKTDAEGNVAPSPW